MTQPAAPSLPDLPSLPGLLGRIAAELTHQAAAVRGLHALVEGGTASGEAVRLAQTIDTASQHLDEIALLLARLAPTAADRRPVDPALAAPMTLSALRDRLFGDAQPSDDREAGDLDLF